MLFQALRIGLVCKNPLPSDQIDFVFLHTLFKEFRRFLYVLSVGKGRVLNNKYKSNGFILDKLSEVRFAIRGHSKTTLTIFCTILTTYLPPVDMFTKQTYLVTLTFEEKPSYLVLSTQFLNAPLRNFKGQHRLAVVYLLLPSQKLKMPRR